MTTTTGSDAFRQYQQVLQQTQEAALAAVDSWTKVVQDSVGQLPTAPTAQVDPTQVVDQVFDFAEKMLDMQRDFTKRLLESSASIAQTATARGEAQTPSV